MKPEQDVDLMQRPIRVVAPSGGHTPMPWKKGGGRYDNGHIITSQTGAVIAFFQNEADRDLALYFVNARDGMVRVLEECADKFEVIAQGSKAHDGTAACATEFATTARTYAEIFRNVGEIKPRESEEVPLAPR